MKKIANMSSTNIEIDKYVSSCSGKLDNYGTKMDFLYPKIKTHRRECQ